MEITIARGRWQEHLKSGGDHYHERARELEALHAEHPSVGADVAALAHHALAELLERCRVERLTRHQHILMRLGALIAQVEGAAALARRAQRAADKELNPKASRRLRAGALAAMSRVYARDAALAVATEAVRWVAGADGDARRARAAPRPRVDPSRTGRAARRPRAGQGSRLRADAAVRRPAMTDSLDNAAAIVGVSAILPDAPNAAAFWRNVTTGRYSISDVDPERWDPALYYDPDPKAPEKTYSKIGGWVREWEWDPFALEAPDPAQGGRRDGRRPQVGRRLLAHGADGRRLAGSSARPRSHRRDHRQRPLGREALPDGAADHVPRPRARARAHRELRRAARGRALGDRGRAARQVRRLAPGDHRGHDAGRARQLHRRPDRQPVQPPRAQLHDRRGLRVRAGRDGRDRRRTARPRVRRRDHRRHRPQHGRPHVRQVLRDRRALAQRHPPVLGGRRRLRDGRRRARCSSSSGSPMPSATRTGSTPWSAGWAARATARARASPPPTRLGSASPSSGPGGTRGCRPRSAPSSRATAPRRAWATRSS